jgi:hypothetical protein
MVYINPGVSLASAVVLLFNRCYTNICDLFIRLDCCGVIFNQLHERRWIEKMNPDATFWFCSTRAAITGNAWSLKY